MRQKGKNISRKDSRLSASLRSLVEAVSRGNPRAIGQAISLVEDNGPEADALLRALYPLRKESLVIGITGAPGTGKSTLVDQLIERFRAAKIPVGVVAVDPSSPFSGGAILGDRIRMMRHSADDGVFIRSMATRGYLGGLAKATGDVINILEAARKEYILVETVGVGQDEVDVVRHSDLVVVVLTPGAGDDIQAFKAGVMEIGDLFVLNKADLPEADRAERQLRSMLELAGSGDSIPPIIKTVATRGEGIEELEAAIKEIARERDNVRARSRRKQLISWMLRELVREKLYSLLLDQVKPEEVDSLVEKISERQLDPYTAADYLCQKLRTKGRRKGE